jgi:solute carrier family 25 folate transporter 32
MVFIEDKKARAAISGVTSGLAAAAVFHPVDMVKTRLQVQMNRRSYTGFFNAATTIVRKEGGLALFQGITPNLVGNATAWGVYYCLYNTFKNHFHAEKRKLEEATSPADAVTRRTDLSYGEHFAAASGAGVIGLAVTNPIWVVKTRMCLQSRVATGVPAAGGVASTSAIGAGVTTVYVGSASALVTFICVPCTTRTQISL